MQDNQEDNIVYYCSDCHSMCVLVNADLAGEDWDGSYCGKCGSTNIVSCTIDEWLAEEEHRKEVKRQIEWNR